MTIEVIWYKSHQDWKSFQPRQFKVTRFRQWTATKDQESTGASRPALQCETLWAIAAERLSDANKIVGKFSLLTGCPILFVTIVGILLLCVIDAFLTMYLLRHGAYEANPLMALLLNKGPYIFIIFKYAITMIAAGALFIFRGVVVRKINVTTHSFLYLSA